MVRPGRLPGSPLDPFIAAAFWTLAVIVLINPRGIFPPGVNTGTLVFAGLRVLCCLLLMGLVHARLPQALGAHGALILGSMASYLVIGFFVSVATDAEVRVHLYGFGLYEYVKDTAISLVLILVSALGAYAILERVGMQAFLRSVLMILTASSTVVVFTPVLRSMGVLLPWRTLPHLDPMRFPGAFWDPNSAGYIGCMTAVLALAFLGNVRRPVLAYLALTAGSLAAVLSWSKTAIICLGVTLTVFLLLNGRSGRGRILFWMGATALTGVIFIRRVLVPLLSSLEVLSLLRLSEIVGMVTGERINDTTLSNRLFLWTEGMRRALESPIVGQGLGRFYLLYEDFFFASQGVIASVHNTYLLLLGEAGIVPLSLYLLYLFSLLRLRWTLPKSLARDAIVGWTIIVVLQGMAYHQLFQLGIYIPFLGGVTCAMASYATHWSGGWTRETPRTFAGTKAETSATG